MITVTIRRNREGEINMIRVNGHAGYAEEGSDIICAGVSTLVYTAIGAIETLCEGSDFYEIRPDPAGSSMPEAEIRFPVLADEVRRKTAAIILETAGIGLLQLEQTIRDDYGNQYLRVKKTVETSRRCKQ